MADEWYPQDKKELNILLDSYLKEKPKVNLKSISGIIVPHAGYAYSGAIAGKVYALLKNSNNLKNKRALILSPSHYLPLSGVASHNKDSWKTPLGSVKILDSDFPKVDLSKEHAIGNQIPFLQKLSFKEITPLVIGKISKKEAEEIAKKIAEITDNSLIIVSTDLSHFLKYDEAVKKDSKTIKAISTLNFNKLAESENTACGIFPLMVLMELCKLKNWKPELIEYKNSGDIIGEKDYVVGYASFSF